MSNGTVCQCGEKLREPTGFELNLVAHDFVKITKVCDGCGIMMVEENFNHRMSLDSIKHRCVNLFDHDIPASIRYTKDYAQEMEEGLASATRDLREMIASLNHTNNTEGSHRYVPTSKKRIDTLCNEESSSAKKYFKGNTLAGKNVKIFLFRFESHGLNNCECGSHEIASFLLTNGEGIIQCSECLRILDWNVECPSCGDEIKLLDDKPASCMKCRTAEHEFTGNKPYLCPLQGTAVSGDDDTEESIHSVEDNGNTLAGKTITKILHSEGSACAQCGETGQAVYYTTTDEKIRQCKACENIASWSKRCDTCGEWAPLRNNNEICCNKCTDTGRTMTGYTFKKHDKSVITSFCRKELMRRLESGCEFIDKGERLDGPIAVLSFDLVEKCPGCGEGMLTLGREVNPSVLEDVEYNMITKLVCPCCRKIIKKKNHSMRQ